MKCQSCAQPNDAGLKFCVSCGSALTSMVSLEEEFQLDSLLAPGTFLKGTYELIRVLGEGGAGVVYEGRHVSLGNPVAVKILFSELARISQIKDRFVEEGRIQANIRHPNLVGVNDIVEEDDLVAIVMEYIEGETLHLFIQRQRNPVSINKAVGIMLRVLAGLGVAHANGIVHRDIKPGNILLATTDLGVVPKVCDFGIAKVEGTKGVTVSGTKMGTLHYMAPEQFQDARTVDARADIYSLGCTLFELITRRLPFDSDNEYALMRAHLDVKPPSMRSYRRDVPEELEKLVLRCLEKRPEDRYQDANQLAEALLSIPLFETMRDFRSTPAVTEVDKPPKPTGMGVPNRQLKMPARASVRPEPPAPVAVKPRPKRSRRPLKSEQPKKPNVPLFPIFLGLFFAVLVAAVVVFAVGKEKQQPLPGIGDSVTPKTEDLVHAQDAGDEVVAADTGDRGLPDARCTALLEQTLEFVTNPLQRDRPIPMVVGEQLDSDTQHCTDQFMAGVHDNRFDRVYMRVRSDTLIIASNLYRLENLLETSDRCLQVALVSEAYRGPIARIDLTLGEVSAMEAGSLREMRTQLSEGQARFWALTGDCRD